MFSEGAKDVLKELKKNQRELGNYLKYDFVTVQILQSILSEIGRTSKADEGYEGLIEDIVMIRHQLTHFSAKKASSYHTPKLKLLLAQLNNILYNSCFWLLRNKAFP
ncbi:MAG: hypothetical protein JWM28_2765 [Chitinophagaceae bacterium]|nr:hypothetical protein [Chitinophagaceae bacterium]